MKIKSYNKWPDDPKFMTRYEWISTPCDGCQMEGIFKQKKMEVLKNIRVYFYDCEYCGYHYSVAKTKNLDKPLWKTKWKSQI